VERHWNAERLQPIDEIAARDFLGRRAGFADQGHESLEQRAWLVEPNRVSGRRFERCVFEDIERCGNGHVCSPWSARRISVSR
jgi:hypothetical protein